MSFLDNDLEFTGDTKTLGGMLQDFGNILQDQLRNSLDRNTSSGTSKQGEQSIKFQIDFKSLGVYRFQLFMEDYLNFIDQGVTGVGGNKADGTPWAKKRTDGTFSYKQGGFKPPVNFSSRSGNSLKQWSNAKGLNEYAVRESIFHRGIKATHFYQDVVKDDIIKNLSDSLARAGGKSFELDLVEILTNK